MPIYALVLTTPPRSPSLSDLVVERAWTAIPEGMRRAREWLAPGEAWHATFVTNDTEASAELTASVSELLRGITIDVNVVLADPALRRKRMIIADMDSTIIEQECIDEIADFAGVKARVAEITELAMNGEIDFASALRERVGLIRGLEVSALERVASERLTLMPGARTLVRTMKLNGAFTALVSGGFTYFTSRIAERVGFDVHSANTLLIEGGRLTGEVGSPIQGREAKLASLRSIAADRDIGLPLTLAVGDGANDLAMLAAAGLGVAYRAKPNVAAQARTSIVHGDLTSLLYLQGYHREEFFEA